MAIPGQVTALVIGTATATTQPLTWTAPSAGGAVTGHTVEYKLSSASSWSSAATGLPAASYTVTGLTAGLAYDFRVSATNPIGAGSASAPKSGWMAVAGGSPSTTTFTGADANFGFNGASNTTTAETPNRKRFNATVNEQLTHWIGYVVGTACELYCGGGATGQFSVSIDGAAYTAPVQGTGCSTVGSSLTSGTGGILLFTGLTDVPHLVRIVAPAGYNNNTWFYSTGNSFVVTGTSPGLSAGPDLGGGIASSLSYIVTDSAGPLAPNYITKAAATNFTSPAANVPTLTNTSWLRQGSVAFNATMRDLWVSAKSAKVYISIDGGPLLNYDTVTVSGTSTLVRKVNFEFDVTAQHKYHVSVEANTLWIRIGGPGAAFGTKPVLNLAAQLGDSITEAISYSVPSTASSDIYGVAAALGAVGLPSGLSGVTASSLKAACTSTILVAGMQQQKVFVIAIGANDGLTTTGPTDYPNTGVSGNFGFDYQNIIDQILTHSPSAKVICRGLVPVEHVGYTKDSAIAACVTSRANANVTFQSVSSWTGVHITTGSDAYNGLPSSTDGQHPTPYGYKLLAAYAVASSVYTTAFA